MGTKTPGASEAVETKSDWHQKSPVLDGEGVSLFSSVMLKDELIDAMTDTDWAMSVTGNSSAFVENVQHIKGGPNDRQ